jgi:hypothetical protein
MNIKTILLILIFILYLFLINIKKITNESFILNKCYNQSKNINKSKNKNDIKSININITIPNNNTILNNKNNLKKNRLCSYIITLPKRLNNVTNIILPNLNFSTKTKIFNAILKNTINKEELIKNNKLNYKTKLNEGQLACHLSHLSVMEQFLKTNYKYCLIFEDDLKKPKKIDYNLYIHKILDYIDKDTDLIYLGSCFNSCSRDQQTQFKGLKRCFRPLCRHAYIVSKEGATKILDNYNTIPQLEAGDLTIGGMILNNQLKSYCSVPPLFFQNREELGTNLGNTNTIKFCSAKFI